MYFGQDNLTSTEAIAITMIPLSQSMHEQSANGAAPELGLRRPIRTSALVMGMVLGSALALVGILVVLALSMRETVPRLTRAELEAAQDRWEAKGPKSYTLDVIVSGGQTGEYHIEVQRGRPVVVTRNGIAPRRGTWESWTVPGLFEVIRQELDNAEDPDGCFGAPAGSEAVLRAELDERYGYPQSYQRSVLDTRLGRRLGVQWEITRFVAE